MYLKKSKTIVIKIGSSIIIDKKKKIRKKWLMEFAKDIKDLLKKKKCNFGQLRCNSSRLQKIKFK